MHSYVRQTASISMNGLAGRPMAKNVVVRQSLLEGRSLTVVGTLSEVVYRQSRQRSVCSVHLSKRLTQTANNALRRSRRTFETLEESAFETADEMVAERSLFGKVSEA